MTVTELLEQVDAWSTRLGVDVGNYELEVRVDGRRVGLYVDTVNLGVDVRTEPGRRCVVLRPQL